MEEINVIKIVQIYFGLWVLGFLLSNAKVVQFRVTIPKWMGKILFIKSTAKNVPIVAVLFQLWVYLSGAGLAVLHYAKSGINIEYLSVEIMIYSIIITSIAVLPDAILHTIRSKKRSC